MSDKTSGMARDLVSGGEGVLRFITCGSVDDGKSTLIGRLLYDSRMILEDQLLALRRDTRRLGGSEEIDYALLLDGLEAEREQGITIDVAYRFFATERRRFIVADTPGHEQYTRNMATGASTADLAIILMDARKGVLTQTRRHSFIVSMMGVKNVILAVNKMDLVGYGEDRFRTLEGEYRALAGELGFQTLQAIPLSALKGDNVAFPSGAMGWYRGPTLIEALEGASVADEREAAPFRLPVQWVNRPNLDFRGFSGTISSGRIRVGDDVVVARSGRASSVRAIVTADGDLPEAAAGHAVTLVLSDEIDASRGDVFAHPQARPEMTNRILSRLIWMHEDGMSPEGAYLMKIGAQTVPAKIAGVEALYDVRTFGRQEGRWLQLNEIGECIVASPQLFAFDPYRLSRDGGAFILIDRYTRQTVAAGMIDRSLTQARHVHRHAMDVRKADRCEFKGHRPAILWFTGLSGAGKSTIANIVEQRLWSMGAHTYSLDGDNVRQGLNRDLGFSDADRIENIRRIGEVSRLFVDAGLIVTVSFISPFRSERDMVRALVGPDEFIEIFVDAPLDVCLARDPKGLYRKARAGEITNFTGIDSPYEPPLTPELRLETAEADAPALAERVIALLRERGIISGDLQRIDFSI
jgi:bifunctional enzyme CysN/CysC